MPFTDRIRQGSIFVEPRNRPARFNPQRELPEVRVQRQRNLRARSPLIGQLVGQRIKQRRWNRQRIRSRRLRR